MGRDGACAVPIPTIKVNVAGWFNKEFGQRFLGILVAFGLGRERRLRIDTKHLAINLINVPEHPSLDLLNRKRVNSGKIVLCIAKDASYSALYCIGPSRIVNYQKQVTPDSLPLLMVLELPN